MNPQQLFPWLAAVFVALALVSGLRRRQWRGAPLIWLWMAFCFGAVSLWLRYAA